MRKSIHKVTTVYGGLFLTLLLISLFYDEIFSMVYQAREFLTLLFLFASLGYHLISHTKNHATTTSRVSDQPLIIEGLLDTCNTHGLTFFIILIISAFYPNIFTMVYHARFLLFLIFIASTLRYYYRAKNSEKQSHTPTR